MTVSVVQHSASGIEVSHSSHTETLPSPPTAGNTLVLDISVKSTTVEIAVPVPSGWTERLREWTLDTETVHLICTKVAEVGASSSVTVTFPSVISSLMRMYETDGAYLGGATAATVGAHNVSVPIPSITPATSIEALLVASASTKFAYGIATQPTGYTDFGGNQGIEVHTFDSVRLVHWSKYVASASGSYSATVVYTNPVHHSTAHVWFGAGTVVADFTYTPADPVIGQTIAFTDTSGGTPTSWAWDFGDSGTSTSQNPTHAFTGPGTYSVTLTATNAGGSDDVTKSILVVIDTGYEDPPPANAILEIYAADPGSARWDVAKWDEDVWGAGGWQDVTPYGITVEITWGSDRPELGILNVPQPASWAVDYHDPDRILDPANPDGPYYGDLLPGLPIRLSHRGIVVRQGHATGIGHSYRDPQTGYMRGADVITILANAQVPSDTELSDTLYARAADAIAAAGLSLTIQTSPGVDPPVSPWITGTREWSAWQWITDAAQEVLRIPYVNRLNMLTFRPWALPLVRGRSINADELVDLTVISDFSGQFSVVEAREDVDTVVVRALTPPPRYGARTYTRNEITIDPGAWADAVLADRGIPSHRWEPGSIRPLTANSLEDIATIEATERISMALPGESPSLFVTGIVVGGVISVRGRTAEEAVWRFRHYVAGVTNEPLIETGGEPTDYLERTGGGEYLYPTGSGG